MINIVKRQDKNCPCGIVRQNFDFNLEKVPENISYERRDYESVDGKNLL